MIYKGNVVSEGIAIGKAFVCHPTAITAPHTLLTDDQVPCALAEYARILDAADRELAKLEASSDIFTAHRELLRDEEMVAAVKAAISHDHYACAWAVEAVYNQYAGVFDLLEDPLLRERASDIRDIRRRLLSLCLGGGTDLAHLPGPCLVVAHDLLPSDTATLDRNNVLGIITEVGGPTCHSAIIARGYGLPAVLGIPGIVEALSTGDTVILDAVQGTVIAQPDEGQLQDYAKRRDTLMTQKAMQAQWHGKPCHTADGVAVEIGLNVACPTPEELHALSGEGVDYVGLFRTEFVYMQAHSMPTEEEQFAQYQALFSAAGDKYVTLRTLDIGADKTLSYYQLPQEDNPVLGLRALRLCLSDPALFHTQLRAALRASVFGKLQLMFPMVGSLDDFLAGKEAVTQVCAELDAQGIPYNREFKLGIMIEIPSAAMIADVLAAHADFASIGTNDLCQYLMAADRMNPQVSGRYCQSYHPAVFRLISYAVEQFNQAGKPISVCGEMGGDSLAAPVLVGMGMRHLSMSLSRMNSVKMVLSRHTISQLEQLAHQVCRLSTAEEAEKLLRQVLL